MKVQLLAATSLFAAVIGLASIELQAADITPSQRGISPSLDQPGVGGPTLSWTLEPVGQPKQKVIARKTPTSELVMPTDPDTGAPIATGRLVVKFADHTGVRAPLSPAPFPISLTDLDLNETEQILATTGSMVRQWINRTEAELQTLAARAEAFSGRPQPDLATVLIVEPAADLLETARLLNDLDLIDWVWIEQDVIQCAPQQCPGCGACDTPCNAADPIGCTSGVNDCNPDVGCLQEPPNCRYGCQDNTCCDLVAAIAPACNDPDSGQGWDWYCATIANVICEGTVFDNLNPSLAPADRYDPCLTLPEFAPFRTSVSGSCLTPGIQGRRGCQQPNCCNAVCDLDPFCCSNQWDSSCATLAQALPTCDPTVDSPTPSMVATVDASGNVVGQQAYTIARGTAQGSDFANFSNFSGGGFDLAEMRAYAVQEAANSGDPSSARLNGRGIRVGVLDRAYEINHEEFVCAAADPTSPVGECITPYDTPRVITEPGQTFIDLPGNAIEHGSAVLGAIVAGDNGFGITGIAHEAQGYFFPIASEEDGGFRLQNAMISLMLEFGPGDVACLPIGLAAGQAPGPFATQQPLPTAQPWWTLLRSMTDLGILATVPAGNACGAVADEAGAIRSGALVVGATFPGTPSFPAPGAPNPYGWPGFVRIGSSNFYDPGSALASVDLFAWGTGICTTGGGTFFRGAIPTQPVPPPPGFLLPARTYQNFGGTSGASAMIAGAAAVLQAFAWQRYDTPLSPETLGGILKSNGRPQAGLPYSDPGYPGNDLPCGFDVIPGEEIHRVGQSLTGDIGFMPLLEPAAQDVVFEVEWESNVSNYRVMSGREFTPYNPYRLRAIDSIAVGISAQRRNAGVIVGGLTYLATGWTSDLQVTTQYSSSNPTPGLPLEIIGLQVRNVASSSRAGILRIVYVLNQTTRRWVYLGLDVMPGPQYTEATFALAPFYDPEEFINPNDDTVTVRIWTFGGSYSPPFNVNHDFVSAEPNPYIPVP